MEKEKEKNYARRYAHEFNWTRAIWQYWSSFFVALPIFLLFYKLEIHGRHNIPKDRKYIIAGNHISFFDPFLAFLAVIRPIAFMAKKELFESEKTLKWMDRLGAFSVNRENLEVSTIKTVKDLKKTNWILGIFPQGGIRKNRKIENINKGFAVIAKAAKEDILPLAIRGCEEYNWIPLKSKIIVEIGTPISHELEPDDIIDQWSSQIAQMTGYELVSQKHESSEYKEFTKV